MSEREVEARACAKCSSANTRRIGGSIEPHLDYVECRDCGYITVALVPEPADDRGGPSDRSDVTEASAADAAATPAPAVDVLVSGIVNDDVRAALEAAVRDVFARHPTHEPWKIVVAPADSRGRWNVSVIMPAQRHIASMTVPMGRLADTVSVYLRRMLVRIEKVEAAARTQAR